MTTWLLVVADRDPLPDGLGAALTATGSFELLGADDQTVRSALGAGALAYVSRCDGLSTLHAALDEVLRRHEQAGRLVPGPPQRTAEPPQTPRLTPQQSRVLELTVEGLTYREVGARLFISESTVRFHMQKLKARFEARSKADLVARAITAGAIAPQRRQLGGAV